MGLNAQWESVHIAWMLKFALETRSVNSQCKECSVSAWPLHYKQIFIFISPLPAGTVLMHGAIGAFPSLCFLQGLKAKLGFACWCIRQKLQVMGSEGCQRLCNRILWLNKLLLHWGIFRWQSSFDFTSFSFLDVRQGLIGVGLINVEDRSGILTLDKGTWVFNASVQCLWEHLMSW